MDELEAIKRHADAHDVGSAIIGDHVAIGVMWTSHTISGEERRRETTERVQSFREACGVIGCRCGGVGEAA
ncbi:MAG: hypothetical protein ACOZAA_04775 [Pseudomonadota bacterium]